MNGFRSQPVRLAVAFRVGALPKFYVEAKKCDANISADPAPGALFVEGQKTAKNGKKK